MQNLKTDREDFYVIRMSNVINNVNNEIKILSKLKQWIDSNYIILLSKDDNINA